MTDWNAVVRDAKARLAQIDEERANLLGVIRHAEPLAGLRQAPLAAAERHYAAAPKARSAPTMAPTRKAVHAILSSAGRPMETRELLPLVREHGVDVGGKDPIATLSARLSNSEDFQNRRGVGWWFAGQGYPGEIGFEEAEGTTVEGQPSASNSSQGGSEDAAALDNKWE